MIAVLDDRLLTAQVFIFFVAGFETSSSTMAFCMYELATNEDVQEAARQEVDDILAELDGKPITYEHIAKMNYIEKVLLGEYGRAAWSPHRGLRTKYFLEPTSLISL